MKNIRLILLSGAAVALLGFAALSGCNGNSKPIGPGAGPSYTVQGAVVKDANRNGTVSVAAAVSDDTTVSAVTVQFSADTLLFNDPNFTFFTGVDSVYSHTQTPVTSVSPGQHWLYVMDSSGFKDSIMTAVADTFSITTVTPFNRILQGVQQVTLEWSTTNFVDGYIIAAVKEGKTYQQTGYAAEAASGVNSGTIPPDAFLASDGLSPDTGLFHLYVYAYYGSPDSALVSTLLPTYFPLQVADNIDFDFVKGHFGTVTVTAYDTVRVMLTK
jgi:hypothetical protein